MSSATRFSSLRRCDSGAAAIEFALIAMVAICVFIGIVEFGRALYMRNELSFAADRAARMILTNPTVADSDLDATIRSSVTFGVPEPLELTFGTESVDGVSFRTLQLSQPLVLLIPDFAPGITLTISRRVPVT